MRGELEGAEERAPTEPPTVADIEVHEPVREGDGWSSGGVKFVLCGVDGLGDPYESEVLVFDGGAGLLAAAAVFWTGSSVSISPPEDGGVVTVGEPDAEPSQCP